MKMNFNKIKSTVRKYCEDGVLKPAEFLKVTGAIGWTLSSAAQLLAIGINNEIPQKEKKFLIPHEIFDGVINISLFLAITSQAQSFAQKLVYQKKVIPKFIKESKIYDKLMDTTVVFKKRAEAALELGEIKAPKLRSSDCIDQMVKFIKKFEKEKGPDGKPLLEKGIADDFEKVSERFATFVSILGSIVSMNIVTPIIRNKIASVLQAKALNHNINSHTIDHATLPAKPIINSPPALKPTNYLQLAQQHYSRTKI